MQIAHDSWYIITHNISNILFFLANSVDDFAAMAENQLYKKQYYNDFIARAFDGMANDLSYGKN